MNTLEEDKKQTTIASEYREILKQIGIQIGLRKNILIKRSAQKTWPFLITIVFSYILLEVFRQFGKLEFIIIAVCTAILGLLLSVVWYGFIGMILNLEKHIWVDSYFDKKNLTADQSWGIAKQLFFPVLKLRIAIFFKYQFIPLMICFVLTAISLFFVFKQWNMGIIDSELSNNLLVVSLFLPSILYIIYLHYLKIKLRFIWFLFLDMWGNEFTYKRLFDELSKFNNIRKNDYFKKSLTINFGTDSTKTITDTVLYFITADAGSSSAIQAASRDMVRFYGSELSHQVSSVATIAGWYILYQLAHKQVFGYEQNINDNLYKLVQNPRLSV